MYYIYTYVHTATVTVQLSRRFGSLSPIQQRDAYIISCACFIKFSKFL